MKKIVLLLSMGLLLFSCRSVDNPSVHTFEVTNITATTATYAGDITADGGAAIIARGFCWCTSPFPTIADSKTSNGGGLGSFTDNITGLSPNTTYYVRAHATNAKGTAYGQQKTFTTNQEMPTVLTGEVTNITAKTATFAGNVTADGGAYVTTKGFCWSTSENPTTSNYKTTNGTGLGAYISNITGLSPNTTYYVKAYATNAKGTAYGEQKTFTTNPEMPTVVTSQVTNITTTTASCSGNVTSDGNAAVTARGVCWSTSENPTTSNSKTTDGTGLGTYTSNISDLSPNTTYYVRAYATNSVGTAYGKQRTFTTNAIIPPSVKTGDVTNISTTTADCSGNVTSDGNAAVTARGVCWSTSENPTTSNSKTTDGTGLGTYTSNISDLSPNTTYYVRAYATNSVGTAYGEQKLFRTYDTFTDSRDGHVYKTLNIDGQVWMVENLAYLPTASAWQTESSSLPCYYVYGYNGTSVAEAEAYNHTPSGTSEYFPEGAPFNPYTIYGVLYNWPAAMNGASSSNSNPSGVQGICPDGWHLPSDAEWTTLTTYLGGEEVAGGKMKEAGTDHWNSPNIEATNSSGFTALPGGWRSSGGYFYSIGYNGLWWSSTQTSDTNAWERGLNYFDNSLRRNSGGKYFGFSVRCVRD